MQDQASEIFLALECAREGSLSWPIALTSTVDSNVSSPSFVFRVEIQRRLPSSQREEVSCVLRRRCSRMPYSAATFFR